MAGRPIPGEPRRPRPAAKADNDPVTLPTGSRVTFLFTDIEGSTRLEQAVGTNAWAAIVGAHDELLRAAIEAHGGVVVKTEGDAFFAAFADPSAAVVAVAEGQRALAARDWPNGIELRIRAGLHVGEGRLRLRGAAGEPEDYVGIDVNYTARISAAANGGQVLLSDALVRAIGPELDPTLARSGTRLVDAGLRRVKDFDDPLRLHRLVVPGAADDDRPLRTLEAPSNLPREATSLIGRDEEIAKLGSALAEQRVVTLTGPGGSGKTRLAIGVAEAIRSRFPHGAWFVDLASVREPNLLELTVAAILGVRDAGDQPIDAALRSYLRDRETLLVLDNLEQLLPEVASRVAALVRGSAGLRVLATTRELLRIGGEYGYAVPPLAMDAGIALFEDRARLHRPGLEFSAEERSTIQAICDRLAGLPLAIELAAARIRMLPLAAILERLGRTLDLAGGTRDQPERQRTLRGAIDWSHDLLAEPERRLFRRLSVFAGGWTAEAAMEIVDDGTLGADLFELMESLVDKSLVRLGGGDEHGGTEDPFSGNGDAASVPAHRRFSMHPLLREYAAERLEEAGERDAFEARHAAAFAERAVAAGGRMLGPDGAAALHELDLEQHNCRAAVEYLASHGELGAATRAVASTWRWFQQRGRLGEGRALLGRLLEMPGAHDDRRTRIAGLEADGGLAYWMGDRASVRQRYEERLALAEAEDDPALIAAASYDYAFVFVVDEDVPSIERYATRARDLYESLGDEMGVLRANQALNLMDFLKGDFAAAEAREEANLEAFRRAGRTFNAADSLTLLSGIGFRRNAPDRAWARLIEGLEIFSRLDLASGLARGLGMAAILQLASGDAEFGARLAGATMELGRTKNVIVAPAWVLHLPAPEVLAVERLGEERAKDLMADGAATPVEEMIREVLAATPPPGDGPTSAEA